MPETQYRHQFSPYGRGRRPFCPWWCPLLNEEPRASIPYLQRLSHSAR